jgi:tetratricopeptide (TPR) repeat protein
MKRAAVILLAMGLCFALPEEAAARATADAQLVRARDRFDYGDYADAVRILRRLLDEGRLVSGPQLVEAHRLLGVSHYYLGDEDACRGAFVRLLSIEPDYRLDPFFHPPKLVEFFDSVKAENEALLAPLRDQRRLLEEQRRLEEEARRRLLEEEERRRLERQRRMDPPGETDIVVERIVTHHTYIVNWLPFGAGQFQNEDQVKGIGLATAQVVTGAASVLGFAIVASAERCYDEEIPSNTAGDLERPRTVRRCGIPPESLNMVETMNRVKWIAGGMFWALVGYGIVDAHLNFQPFKVVSEQRIRLDPADEISAGGARGDLTDLQLQLSPWLSPDTLGAQIVLRF